MDYESISNVTFISCPVALCDYGLCPPLHALNSLLAFCKEILHFVGSQATNYIFR